MNVLQINIINLAYMYSKMNDDCIFCIFIGLGTWDIEGV